MKAYRVAAHILQSPAPPGWRDRLAARIGERPRRLGRWAELAVFGARLCLDAAGETDLPAGARLRVASFTGALSATRACLDQCRHGQPMPFSFMQSQPSHMLAALSHYLGWRGDASFVVCRDKRALRQLAERDGGDPGVLLGWVEETDPLHTEWWRLVPAEGNQPLA